MAQDKAAIHIAPPPPPPQATPAKTPKPKATQSLPSNKMMLAKQLAVLRAYAAVSGQNAKPVKISEVADVSGTTANTISTANPFFVATGLIQKAEGGFVPSAEVLAFAHAYEWDSSDATAAHKLAPVIAETWFAKEILKKLSFEKLKESDAVTSLAQYAAAPPDCKPQVKQLIDYLEVTGIVQRDGDVLKKGSAAATAASPARQPATTGGGSPPPSEPEHRETPHREAQPQPARSSVSTAFSQMAGGAVQFNVTVKVDMNEFAGWQPDRIAAFFHGIAEVLTAKGGMERESSQE